MRKKYTPNEEFRLTAIAIRAWTGQPISPQDYAWLKEQERLEQASHWGTVALGTEAAARRALMGW